MVSKDQKYTSVRKLQRRSRASILIGLVVLIILGVIFRWDIYFQTLLSKKSEESLIELSNAERYKEVVDQTVLIIKRDPLNSEALFFQGVAYFYQALLLGDSVNQKLMLDHNSFSVSPGNLLKFNYLFDTFNINLNNDFLDNLKILLMELKKEKNIFYLELIRFYIDYYLDIQKNKKYFTLEKFVEKRSFLFKNIYNYFYYNLNQNTLFNNISHQFKNE